MAASVGSKIRQIMMKNVSQAAAGAHTSSKKVKEFAEKKEAVSRLLLADEGRGFASRASATYKNRKQSAETKEFKARLFIADENFGFARTYSVTKDANKIVATCVQSLKDAKSSAVASANIKALKSKGATVIGEVNPGDVAKKISGKTFNNIYIQFPEADDETKKFFAASKNMLRSYGVVEVLLEPKKVVEVKKLAEDAGLVTKKKMENFVAANHKYYTVPPEKDSSAPAPSSSEEDQKKQKEEDVITAGFKLIHMGSN